MITESGKIQEVDLTQTLPRALQYDEDAAAFAKAFAALLHENANLLFNVGFYYRIGELTETVCDILAADLHVDWYDYKADLETKRSVIASSVYVHKYAGTPAAVLRVIEDAFTSGSVEEWFDYGGTPWHFKITATLSAETDFEKFMLMLNHAKKASAHLEGLTLNAEYSAELACNVELQTAREITLTMAEEDLDEWGALLTDENGNYVADENGTLLTE
ncbi:MAG: phage tail protein I [Clostridiales bacterium]|nr:phage tail protein I [Clostridiales bacterium]